MTHERLDSSDETVSFPPSEGYAQAILEHGHDVAFVIRRDLRIVYVNQRAVEVTGLDRKAIVGESLRVLEKADIADDEHLSRFTQGIVDILQGRESHVELHMPLHTTLGTVTGHIRLSAIERDENVEHVGGIVRRLPQQLFSTRPHVGDLAFKKIVDQSPHGICFTRRNRFLYVNERFQELLDYEEYELVEEKRFTGVVHFGDQSRVHHILRQLTGGDRDFATFNCRLKTREKDLLPVKAFATRMIYDDEPAAGIRVIRAGSQLQSFSV